MNSPTLRSPTLPTPATGHIKSAGQLDSVAPPIQIDSSRTKTRRGTNAAETASPRLAATASLPQVAASRAEPTHLPARAAALLHNAQRAKTRLSCDRVASEQAATGPRGAAERKATA